MSILSFFRQLYSLDTLDTRFTTSSRTPGRVAAEDSAVTSEAHSEKPGTEIPPGAHPSRWRTREFYLYYLVFILVVPQMFKAVIDVSKPSHPNYAKYEGLLSPGWILGRKVDNSDDQYAGFRGNIPYLAAVMVLHSLLRRLYDRFRGGPVDAHSPTTAGTSPTNGAVAADVSQQRRTSFDLYFALLFITVLHGSSALKILLILYINFSLTALPKHVIPATTWIFNIAILFANELAHGYSYVRILDSIVPLSAPAVKFGNNLDAYGGLIPRWEILFNFTVLRLISFNLDYYWSLGHDQAGARIEEKQVDPTNFSERERISTPAASKTYASFPTYLAYALYSPLYLAGPVITFNDYISQSRYPSPLLTLRRTALYSIRLLLALVSMELLLHTIYAVAISKSSPEWSTYSPFQLAMLAYFNLHIVWQKLLVFWRFFRLWAMIDHVDPPENVVRCMSDNYSTLAFWRGWHRSYNRWIVRYIYIPLGGSGGKGASRTRGVLNMLAIFTFVAVWHDINLRLLAWGWLITLFVLPEVLATVAFPAKKWQGRPEVYRMICGVGAVFNILLMMAANLVGFAVGLDGLTGLLTGILRSQSGWAFLLATCAALYVGVQVMFEVREGELRKGIRLKC